MTVPRTIRADARVADEVAALRLKLEAAERRYRVALALVPDLLLRLKADGTYLEVNSSEDFQAIVPLAHLTGKNMRDFMPEDVAGQLLAAFARAEQTGTVETLECRLPSPTGPRYREVRIMSSGPDEVTVLSRDSTFQHEALAALSESEERFRQLAENVDAVFWVTDAQGRQLVYESPRFAELSGRSFDSLHENRRAWLDIVHPDDQERVSEAYDSARLAVGFDEEYRIVRPDGAIRWVHETAVPVRDQNGRVYRIVGIARGITRSKLAEEALRESEERYRGLFQASRDAVYLTMSDGSLVDCNDAMLELLGYTREEMLRLNVNETYVDRRDRERFHETMVRNGSVVGYDVRLRRRDGTEIDCILTSTLWRSKDGKVVGYQGIARDVTWRRRLEREILNASVREQRRIGQDLHDGLGQQLTGAACLSRALALRLSERAPSEAGEARRIAVLMDEAISETRRLARGLNAISFNAHNLTDALRDLTGRVEGLYGVPCTCDVKGALSVRDPATTNHVYAIVSEAVTNAVKHGQPSEVRVEVGPDAVSVRDDGVGIVGVPDEAEGLGVPIMRYRAQAIGGSLEIGPDGAGRGTLVRLTLHRT